MDTLIIFCANYLYLFAIALAAVYTLLQPREAQKQILLLAVIALPLTYIVAKIGGALYYDPRPFVVGHFTPLIAHAPDNGFPSDHTLLTAAISSVIFVGSRRAGIVLWAITLAIGASRVAAGIHHPADIIGSILIAAAVTWAVYYFLEYIKRRFNVVGR